MKHHNIACLGGGEFVSAWLNPCMQDRMLGGGNLISPFLRATPSTQPSSSIVLHPGNSAAFTGFCCRRPHGVQVFINPSTSDVVATTTAEALAMGKWVVVPDIACNAFFKQFRNCLTYKDGTGFIAAVDKALQKEPAPLSDSELR